MDQKAKLRGFEITSDSLKERFDVELDNGEWYYFQKELEKTWKEMEFHLEGVIVNHIKNSLTKLDYKPVLEEGRLKFKK